MSLRMANSKYRTICEVLREINDLHQENSKHDKTVREKLVEAEQMGKRMDSKLLKYNKKYHKKFWATAEGIEYEKLLKQRLSKSYLVG